MLKIHRNAWLLALLSAALQIVIFPLPDLYYLGWVATAPLLVALLRARRPDTLQFTEGGKLLPARPLQAFVLAYATGILWYAGTCYWVYNTMRQFGGVNAVAALGILLLFCLYLGLYHGLFGLILSLLAGDSPFSRRALLVAPAVWVALELARTRISGFPWDLLGTTQVGNIPLSRIATVTGVYGLSFEILLVNAAVAAAFLVERRKRKPLLLAALGAAVVLEAGGLVRPPLLPADHVANLVQQNIPVQEGTTWTRNYYEETLRELTAISGTAPGEARADLIVWPESPAPFYTSDPLFRSALSRMAEQNQAWVIAGSLGIGNAATATQAPDQTTPVYNSAVVVSPGGAWVGRYDKIHLVPFGEYVPFKPVFGFAGGLTKEVGDFSPGRSRSPLDAEGRKLGVFICYESVFPDEVRRFAANGAEVLVNISNDGWYGDSGAYAQHLKQARMRAVENRRWLLRATNTGVTAAIDPYGRPVSRVPRKIRTVLRAPYAIVSETTFYARHGDWFAGLCAIISLGAFVMRLRFHSRGRTVNG